MNNKIKVVIIGENIHEKQLNPISISYNYINGAETEFDILHLKNDSNIISDLYNHADFDVIITFAEQSKYPILNSLGQHIKDKWIVLHPSSSPAIIGEEIINKFKQNNNNFGISKKLVSIITPCYNTKGEWFIRMYNSIKNQTYNNWEWIILDDSDHKSNMSKLIERYLDELKDFRIKCIKNITNHGNIGYNKRLLGMISQGEYILELDHDDELTPDCLECVVNAFEKYDDVGFVYSDTLEMINENESNLYGENWGWYQGSEDLDIRSGHRYNVSPDINSASIRSIISSPNHVRVWRKDIYNQLNGHNSNLSCVDDYELLVRTFLITKFCHIKKVLYIQHLEHSTTQIYRNKEIQRCNDIILKLYDSRIHDRILELNEKDLIWDENTNSSSFNLVHSKLDQSFNYIIN